jgi:hypothetical protein
MAQIMLITGHKHEASVRRYLRRRRDRSLFGASEAVHSALKRSIDSVSNDQSSAIFDDNLNGDGDALISVSDTKEQNSSR